MAQNRDDAGPAGAGRALRVSVLAILTALPIPALATQAPVQTPDGEFPRLVRNLDSADFVQREAALAALSKSGVVGAKAALEGFESASASARAARAHVVRLQGDATLLARVLELCGDANSTVRDDFAAYLGRALRDHPAPTLALASRAASVLEDLAASDVEGDVRKEALESLSRADSQPAAAALAELARTLGGWEGALAARALSNSPSGGGLLLELVQANFDEKGPRLSESALAVLLAEGYGPALAESEGGGLDARSRRPLSLGGRNPSAEVRSASTLAFGAFLARAQFLGAISRGETVGAALAGEVLDPARVLLASAMFTLTAGSDPTRALVAMDRMTALLEPLDAGDARARFDLAIAHTLAAAAQLALGRAEPASARLEAARSLLSGLASEGLERAGDSGAEIASDVAGERAVVESYALLALLRSGKAPDAPECKNIARTLHELSLRAQLLATVGSLNAWTGDLDSLAHHPHGPFDLLLSNPEWERGLGSHPLDLKLLFARALAAVVPEELPGFESGAGALPMDDTRLALLSQIEYSRLEQVQRELVREPQDSPQRPELENALRVLTAELSPEADLHRVRLPSAMAIELSGELRDEGQSQEASALAERAKEALSRADFLFGGPHIQQLIATAESTLGSCAMDDGKPEAAAKILEAALARLETIAAAGNDDLRSKASRSSVLVSLAVNANVKLHDPTKALAYFERAFELRQDDFTRTLLACYRARAGRSEEARALLREVPESPYNYYNLACTYALIGDTELAFDYLTRELSPGKKSRGALERQRVWARTDPDLASLRGDPRFAALVGK